MQPSVLRRISVRRGQRVASRAYSDTTGINTSPCAKLVYALTSILESPAMVEPASQPSRSDLMK
jgi:hypothetical protein